MITPTVRSLMPDHLTALRNIDGQPATKRHAWTDADGWTTEAYSSGQYFAWSVAKVDGIASLSERLTAIAGEREWFIIRGEPLRSAKYLRRTYKGDDPHFQPVDRRWLCVDIDGMECPDVEDAIAQLPAYFHGVTVHWQLSASAGIYDDRRIRVHLWYWLDRPACDFSLREWAKALPDRLHVDSMLYNPVQPHYTALPIIEGAPDPVDVRCGLLRGSRDELVLPDEVVDLETWSDKERQRRVEQKERLAKLTANNRPAPDAPEIRRRYALSALNAACVEIESAREGDRHRTIFAQAAAVAELFEYVDEGQAKAQLEDAALVALAPEGRKSEAVRTVADGIEYGRQTPRDLSHVGLSDLPQNDGPDDGWLEHHKPITCPKFEHTRNGCAHYLDCGACAREDEFMCVEWLKLNPPHSYTNTPPRAHWSSTQ